MSIFCRRDRGNLRVELLARDFRIAYSTRRGLSGFTHMDFILRKPANHWLGVFPLKSVLQGILWLTTPEGRSVAEGYQSLVTRSVNEGATVPARSSSTQYATREKAASRMLILASSKRMSQAATE